MSLLIGIDIGTTATKAILIDERGNVLGKAEKSYKIVLSHKKWVEQNPEDWWQALKQTVEEVTGQGKLREQVKAISLSTQGATLIPVDRNGKPLRMAITWLDNRVEKQGNLLNQKFGESFFYERTGWKLRCGQPLLEICWLRENEPEVFHSTHKFLFVNDYLIYKLTGIYCNDPSNCSITMLYNLRSAEWDEELLEVAGITADKLSRVEPSGFPVGKLVPIAAGELGLSPKVIVCNGAHDQYSASIGTGTYHSGDLLLSCGAAWVLLCTTDKGIFDIKTNITPGRHALPDKWGAMATISSGGVVMEWFKNNFGAIAASKGSDFYELFNDKAKDILAGSNNLLFYPHFIGSTAPTWRSNARGAIIGLMLSHTPYEIFRGIMEGLGFDTRWSIEAMENLGLKINIIKMIGGAAKSALWTQIVADITGRTVFVPSLTEAACVGAAIVAGVGLGVFKSCEDGFKKLQAKERGISPSGNNRVKYEEFFAIYKEAFWKLQDCYKGIEKSSLYSGMKSTPIEK